MYYLDIEKINLDQYKARLQSQYLIPSQRILIEDIDRIFDLLKVHASNMKDLQVLLRTKQKLISFAETTTIDIDYLTVLRREINSYTPKAVKLRDIIDIDLDIKTNVDLYEYIKTPSDRIALSNEKGIPLERIEYLTKIIDLMRIKWVGTKFAKFMYAAGIETIEDIRSYSGQDLHKRLIEYNNLHSVYKGAINLKDMILLIDLSRDIEIEVDYA